jgi:hypothetical protein
MDADSVIFVSASLDKYDVHIHFISMRISADIDIYLWMTFFYKKKFKSFPQNIKNEYENSLYEIENIKYKNTLFLYKKNTILYI